MEFFIQHWGWIWIALSFLAFALGIETEKHYRESDILPMKEYALSFALSIIPFIMLTLVVLYWTSTFKDH